MIMTHWFLIGIDMNKLFKSHIGIKFDDLRPVIYTCVNMRGYLFCHCGAEIGCNFDYGDIMPCENCSRHWFFGRELTAYVYSYKDKVLV